MATLDVPQVIRRARQRIGLSQEALARRLNATKAAIQHWERGRNQPDLARLFALRSLCPPGIERKDVEVLIRQAQGRVASPPVIPSQASTRGSPESDSGALARENAKLRRQIAKLESTVQRRSEQLRILEDLAAELQRRVSELQAARMPAVAAGVPGSSGDAN